MTRDPDVSALDQRGAAPAPQTQPPSPAGVGFAASLPFVVGLLATIVFVVGLADESVMPFMQETGWPFYAIVAMSWFAALVLTVTLVLAARGMRIPSALSLFFAGLPWLVGVAGARFSTTTAINAVQNADAASRASIMAMGIAEASGARLLGAWCTSALAGALALGLAIAALGQRSTNRKPLFAVVGLALALPLLALAGYAVVSGAFGGFAVYGVVAALGAVVAMAVAAAGAGDSPHARAASLAAAVAPAALVSFLGAVAAMETGGFRAAFGAVAMAPAEMRVMLLAEGAESFVVGGQLAALAIGAMAVAAAVLAGWAVSRERPGIGAIGGGVAMVFTALLVIGGDRAAELATESDVSEMALTPWQNVAGFSPMTISGSSDDGTGGEVPIALVTVDGVRPLGAEPLSNAVLRAPGGSAALATALRAAQGRAGQSPHADLFPPSTNPSALPRDEPAAPNAEPSMVLAIDGRVSASDLRLTIDAARAAGAHSLVLLGGSAKVTPEGMERLRTEAPLISLFATQVASVTLLLESALPAGYADADPLLWHATVGASSAGQLRTRIGAGRAPMDIPASDVERRDRAHENHDDDDPRAVAYLALADDATADSLAALAVGAARESLQPLVVTGAMVGRSEQAIAAAPPPAPPEGLGFGGGLGLGQLGGRLNQDGPSGFGRDARPRDLVGAPQVRAGEVDVRGSLPREVIQRVIRMHLNEVRFCYERELANQPNLAGRVNVRFVISPTGAVQTASVASSTLSSAPVETCVSGAVQRWTFPAPDGGGIVIVDYPFVFNTSN